MNQTETIKDRILQYIAFKGITVNHFTGKCGFSNGYLRQLRRSPTAEKIESIITAFPDLNESWLISGEGKMIKENISVSADHGSVANAGDGNSITNTPPSIVDDLVTMVKKRDDQIDTLIQQISKLNDIISTLTSKLQ